MPCAKCSPFAHIARRLFTSCGKVPYTMSKQYLVKRRLHCGHTVSCGKVIKLFSYSSQLSKKNILLIIVEMPFNIYEQVNSILGLSHSEK